MIPPARVKSEVHSFDPFILLHSLVMKKMVDDISRQRTHPQDKKDQTDLAMLFIKNCAWQSFFMRMTALKKSGFPKEPAPAFKTYDLIEISC